MEGKLFGQEWHLDFRYFLLASRHHNNRKSTVLEPTTDLFSSLKAPPQKKAFAVVVVFYRFQIRSAADSPEIPRLALRSPSRWLESVSQ